MAAQTTGVGAVTILMQVPLAAFEQHGMLLLGGACLLLLVVLVPAVGVEVNSARRWIDLGIVRLQASASKRVPPASPGLAAPGHSDGGEVLDG